MAVINIVGLGPGSEKYLTVEAKELLLTSSNIYLRTKIHPIVKYLSNLGIIFSSFDEIYEKSNNFEEIYNEIYSKLISAATFYNEILYAVPGHPMVAEKTVQLLIESEKNLNIKINIIPGLSCLEVIYSSLKIDPTEGLKILDGLLLSEEQLDRSTDIIITQVYSRLIASDIKLTLMEVYDYDYFITVIKAAGTPEERIEAIPLYELDRIDWLDHLTSIYVKKVTSCQLSEGSYPRNTSSYPKQSNDWIQNLKWVVSRLRAPDGCPWDKEQTSYTLRRYIIEEAYETIDAISSGDQQKICEELGDLLLQVVLQAHIASESNNFDLNDVAKSITTKIIHRHPHVFGEEKLKTPEQVKEKWEQIKKEEKQENESELSDIPKSLPALSCAEKIQRRVKRVNFDWESINGVWDKVEEEFLELKKACNDNKSEEIFKEFGDLLFTIVNLARWLKIDPEDALRNTNERFIKRFKLMEKNIKKMGKTFNDFTIDELEKFWVQAKKSI